ncbi:MAG: SDR family NAD(P)-dependent oxidoreductase [Rhodospirillales bacterium]|jgi:NAD(P)-dependent dehydrogenase (short-subunit alcohol dehydrogenase family)
MRLENKKAIVTGAGGGIGRAICLDFAKEGAAVLCLDINEETVTETVKQVTDIGGRAISIIADVAEEASATAAVQMATDTFGGLNVLVSNAIMDIPYVPLTEIDADDWRRLMDVNFNSSFLFCKHAIPKMAEDGGGSIILVASQLGRVARPGRPWYCGAKGGLINMARAIALDHAKQGIRCNALSPGPIETDRYVSNFDNVEHARKNNFTLFERLGRPDEISPGAVFLASDESSFMTGSDLLIDGGFTAV